MVAKESVMEYAFSFRLLESYLVTFQKFTINASEGACDGVFI